MTFQGGGEFARGRVPEPHGAVVAGARELAPIGRERHPCHRVGAAFEGGGGGLFGGGVPEAYGPVVAGAGELAPIGRERHGFHWPGLAFQGGGGGRAPEAHRPVVAGASELAPIGRERHPSHHVGVAFDGGGGRIPFGSRAPEAQGAVVAGARELAPIGRERHPPHPLGVVAVEDRGAPSGGGIPEPHVAVIAGARELAPIGRERHPGHRAGVAFQGGGEFARWPGPRAARCCHSWRSRAGAHRARRPPRSPCRCGRSRVAVSSPVAGSQSRTVPSSLALASWRPSGENATPVTLPVWPFQGGGELAGGRVPEPHGAVDAGASELATVGRERHPRHLVGVALQHAGQGGWGAGQAPPRRQVTNAGSKAASPSAFMGAGASCVRLARVTARSPIVGWSANR